jgi:hypothetical protein
MPVRAESRTQVRAVPHMLGQEDPDTVVPVEQPITGLGGQPTPVPEDRATMAPVDRATQVQARREDARAFADEGLWPWWTTRSGKPTEPSPIGAS